MVGTVRWAGAPGQGRGMSSSDLTVNEAGPADLIAAVWYTLGFRPLNSLVLVALQGPRGRVGSMLRIDMAPVWFGGDQAAGVTAVLDAAIEALTGPASAAFGGAPGEPEKDAQDGLPVRVVALIAVPDALAVPPPMVVRALPQRIARAGLWLYDLIGVTPTAFRSMLCPDGSCCPPGGRPLSEVEASRVAMAHVLRGDRLATSEADVIGDVGQAVPVGEGGEPEVPGEHGERARRIWWRTWNALLGEAKGWNTDQLALGPLHDSFLRDAIFVRLAAAPGPTRQRFLNQLLAGQSPPDLSGYWEELFSELPDRVLLARGEQILAVLARRGTASERAPLLAVLALLAWYRGNGVRTRLLMERLREEGPELPEPLPRLAGLVEMLCTAGIAPPWVEAPVRADAE
ncbi:hypothetical protein Kisp02_66750 [Kineosporia sp. NBRC 101731]|nr:hypothetical protein Kisp02_66750 [Kineosporia sp. NBRC 101731]